MKKLDIKGLKKVALEQSPPVEKTIKFNIGGEEYEGQVWVRPLSFKDQSEISKAYQWNFNKDDPAKSEIKSIDTRRLQAAQILGSICEDAKGTAFFSTVDEVLDSNPSLIGAMYEAANDVNNFLGKSQKTSLTKTNSGASLSLTESAEKRSKKQSKTLSAESQQSGENTDENAEVLTSAEE